MKGEGRLELCLINVPGDGLGRKHNLRVSVVTVYTPGVACGVLTTAGREEDTRRTQV